MPRCSHTYEDSSQCRRIVGAEQEYCYSHDPLRASERRRNAARGGKAKASGELGRVKTRLQTLASAAKQPKPEPEWEPETPELRAEVLADPVAERDAELAKAQERRHKGSRGL